MWACTSTSHQIRENLVARGVQFHALNMIIQMDKGTHQQEQAELIEKVVAMANQDQSDDELTVPELKTIVGQLVSIEQELTAIRQQARAHGLNIPAINFLVQLMRLHPDDAGNAAINEFVDYAIIGGVDLKRFHGKASDIVNVANEPKQVFPKAIGNILAKAVGQSKES